MLEDEQDISTGNNTPSASVIGNRELDDVEIAESQDRRSDADDGSVNDKSSNKSMPCFFIYANSY
jgi:hypothetical protein